MASYSVLTVKRPKVVSRHLKAIAKRLVTSATNLTDPSDNLARETTLTKIAPETIVDVIAKTHQMTPVLLDAAMPIEGARTIAMTHHRLNRLKLTKQ